MALITGGSQGIGAGIGLELAKAGADISFSYIGDEPSALKTVEKIENCGVKALAVVRLVITTRISLNCLGHHEHNCGL